MPIRLIDAASPRTLEIGGAVFHYRHANGDRVRSVLARAVNARTGAPDGEDAAMRLVAEHVFDWSGIEGADGAPLPWPAAGKGYGGEEKPSAEDVAQRVALLSCLPWNVQSRLDASVAVTFTESTNSGKG